MYSRVVLLLVLVVAVAPTGAVAPSSGSAGTGSTSDSVAAVPSSTANATGAPPASPNVTETRTYDRTPATSGSIQVTLRYEVTTNVNELCIRVPSEATDLQTTGFNASGGYCNQRWDGETANPGVSFTLPVETRADSAPGPYVETEDWALARAVVPGKFETYGGGWRYFRKRPTFEESTIERRVRFAQGAGTVADSVALMGHARTVNWTGTGEQFRVVTPRAGNTSLERYRSVLSEASRDLLVGNRGNVTFVALPNDLHAGSALGDVVLVPAGDEWPFEYTRQTWIHEYVHTRQRGIAIGERMSWFIEASASYYDLRLAAQQGELSYQAFREQASATRYPDAVLTNRSTWQNGGVPYERGPQALAALDARIRDATNGTRTFDDVFYLLNRRSGRVSYSEFKRDVATVANQSLDPWLDRHFAASAATPIPTDGDWMQQPPRPRNFDGDTLTTAEEKRRGLDPFAADSNDDGVRDGEQPETTTRPTTQSPTDTTNAPTATTQPTTPETTPTTAVSTPTPTTANPPSATTPGFGVLPALAALTIAALWLRES